MFKKKFHWGVDEEALTASPPLAAKRSSFQFCMFVAIGPAGGRQLADSAKVEGMASNLNGG
jgi:hypothetical protein